MLLDGYQTLGGSLPGAGYPHPVNGYMRSLTCTLALPPGLVNCSHPWGSAPQCKNPLIFRETGLVVSPLTPSSNLGETDERRTCKRSKRKKYEQVQKGKRFPEHLLLAAQAGLGHEKRNCSKKCDFNQLSQHLSVTAEKKICFGGRSNHLILVHGEKINK